MRRQLRRLVTSAPALALASTLWLLHAPPARSQMMGYGGFGGYPAYGYGGLGYGYGGLGYGYGGMGYGGMGYGGMGYGGMGYGGMGYGGFGYGGLGYGGFGYGGLGYGGFGYPWGFGFGRGYPILGYGMGYPAAPYFAAMNIPYGPGYLNPYFGVGLTPLGAQSFMFERYVLGRGAPAYYQRPGSTGYYQRSGTAPVYNYRQPYAR